jgi:hypothetical protein
MGAAVNRRETFTLSPETSSMDINSLIQDVSPWLIAASPYLIKLRNVAGEEAVKAIAIEASTKIGGVVWDRAKKIWDGLFDSKAEAKPDVIKAVDDVANFPDNEQARSSLQWQLTKLLKEDQGLVEVIARIWQEAKLGGIAVTASGEGSVAIGGDVTGSTIITGDRNNVRK